MIFCWSAHHTATWTTLKWLESHEQISGVVEIRFLDKALLDGSYKYMTVQKWAGERSVVHDHFAHHKDGYQLDLRALALALSTRLVIPMRDPLAVALTAQHRTDIRGQGFDGLDAVRELKMLEGALPLLGAANYAPVFLPWDLAPGPVKREEWLQGYRRSLGLLDREATFRWVQQWRVENTKGDYEYKRAYRQRDGKWLKKRLPAVWDAVCGLEMGMREWLEGVGYRELMWWR